MADAGPFFITEQQQADASSNRAPFGGSDREPVEIALAEPDCEPEHKTNREPDRLAIARAADRVQVRVYARRRRVGGRG